MDEIATYIVIGVIFVVGSIFGIFAGKHKGRDSERDRVIREGINGLRDTESKLKEGVESGKERVDSGKQRIDNAQGHIRKSEEINTDSGSTIKSIRERIQRIKQLTKKL